MDKDFVKEDIGPVKIKQIKDLRAKIRDKVIVMFESKEIRDSVKAQALANFKGKCKMRLQVPDCLQKDFMILMSLSYNLKKKNQDLKRNVKVDEDARGLFMDVEVKRNRHWKRVKPNQA